MRSEKSLISLGFVVISLIWGSTWLAIKVGLDSIPPFYGVALRFTLAAIILFLVMRLRKENLPLDRNSVTLYLTLAFLSFSFPFALVYWGQQHIASGLASILFAAYPFVVAVGSHLYLPQESLTPYKVIGIILGFLGILVIFWSDLRLESASMFGMLAVLASTVMQGTSLVIVKRKNTNTSPTALTLGGMLVGVVIMYGLAFAVEDSSELVFDAKGVGSILYLGTLGTVVTFVVYYWLLSRVQAVLLSLVSFVTPVLAVILGTMLLNEILSRRVFTGAALVLTGILVANGRELISLLHKKRNHLPPVVHQ